MTNIFFPLQGLLGLISKQSTSKSQPPSPHSQPQPGGSLTQLQAPSPQAPQPTLDLPLHEVGLLCRTSAVLLVPCIPQELRLVCIVFRRSCASCGSLLFLPEPRHVLMPDCQSAHTTHLHAPGHTILL